MKKKKQFPGYFLVFECGEGCGKSPQLRRLTAWWKAHGLSTRLTREPGGTPLGKGIRRLLLHTPHEVSPRAELFLYEADRAQNVQSVILPALTLGLIYMGVIARLSRSGMLETLRHDYIRTARAKGLSERRVVWKHAVRLGLMPVITYLGPAIATLITGSFVVEKIFQIPGLGYYFIQSVTTRDYELLTGLLVVYSMFMIVLNLGVDIAYGFLDPRIREPR